MILHKWIIKTIGILPERNSMRVTTRTFFTKCRKRNTVFYRVIYIASDIILLQDLSHIHFTNSYVIKHNKTEIYGTL
ncbi:hypothetical protein HanRHA438_Chr05g0239841 [Helianthus annuus]|nr:hypothetical protein HanRHA438_Chr05g0239841 [Helianthus annuus]